MERDCLLSYGAANLITERLNPSDQFDVHVCSVVASLDIQQSALQANTLQDIFSTMHAGIKHWALICTRSS